MTPACFCDCFAHSPPRNPLRNLALHCLQLQPGCAACMHCLCCLPFWRHRRPATMLPSCGAVSILMDPSSCAQSLRRRPTCLAYALLPVMLFALRCWQPFGCRCSVATQGVDHPGVLSPCLLVHCLPFLYVQAELPLRPGRRHSHGAEETPRLPRGSV